MKKQKKRSGGTVKNNKTILAVAAGLGLLALVFAWLFWGADVPEPTKKSQNANKDSIQALVQDTVLKRDDQGKKLWSLKVKEARQVNDNLVVAEELDGIVYLSNGDEMHVVAKTGKIKPKSNEFELSKGVTARLKNGGFLKADKVEWNQKKDILTATGAVKVVKDDMLGTAEKVITSSKLEHFKMKGKAHVERGGKYEEK